MVILCARLALYSLLSDLFTIDTSREFHFFVSVFNTIDRAKISVETPFFLKIMLKVLC